MDDLSTPIKPNVSLWSRIRQYRKATSLFRTNNKGKQVGRGEDEGKLAALLDITLDVFFEIVAYLRPIDLLQLCRVSKKFRATFMSKSARHLWIATRRNGDILPVPDPLPGMSEPRFAAMLFEHTCFACGADEAMSLVCALGVRFCVDCEKTNVKTGCSLIRWKNKDLSKIIWKLIPMDLDFVAPALVVTDDILAEPNRVMKRFYAPEFKRVVAQYRMLDSQQAIDEFVNQRREYVASVAKSAQAIMNWFASCWAILIFGSSTTSGCCCHNTSSMAATAP